MKQRFSNEFYCKVWKHAGYDKNNLKTICAIINGKLKELCGLVSAEGALRVLENEGKL